MTFKPTLAVYGLSCRLISGSVASGNMCGICSPAQTGFTASEDTLVSGPIMEITSALASSYAAKLCCRQ